MIFVFILFSERIKSVDTGFLWKYLLQHNHVGVLMDVLNHSDSTGSTPSVKEFPENLLLEGSILPSYTKEVLMNSLVKCGYYPQILLSDMPLLMKYLTQNGCLFAEDHPILFYKGVIDDKNRAELVSKFNKYFIGFCEQNDLILLLWKFVAHYK